MVPYRPIMSIIIMVNFCLEKTQLLKHRKNWNNKYSTTLIVSFLLVYVSAYNYISFVGHCFGLASPPFAKMVSHSLTSTKSPKQSAFFPKEDLNSILGKRYTLVN